MGKKKIRIHFKKEKIDEELEANNLLKYIREQILEKINSP